VGADLISFILVGPAKLECNAEKEKQILDRANAILGCVKQWQAHVEEVEIDGAVPDMPDTEIMFAGDTSEVNDYIFLLEKNPAEIHKDFLDLWNDGFARDASSRFIDNDSRRILVAGELSWGDEPDGHGYQTIKAALYLGILDAYGIE
jgi:hypothetical protein